MNRITASQLYDLVNCPHRVFMDAYGDPSKRDEISPFVIMLWERGTRWEEDVIDRLRVHFVDLTPYSLDKKERLTTEAMARREPLIYGGRISEEDLLGDPDILRLEGEGYAPIDIKSGNGELGDDGNENPKPKKQYSVQLALYLDILERKGLASGRHAYVWDIKCDEVRYDFDQEYGTRDPRTPWQDYQDALTTARSLLAKEQSSNPAYASPCKLCWWYSQCISQLQNADDLTLIPELGRSKRDALNSHIHTIDELAQINPDGFIQGKTTIFDGIGIGSLEKFHKRAALIKSPKPAPCLTAPVKLPSCELELFFDIEVDPMRDICYLHGFVERRNGDNSTENFVAFFADDPTSDAEEQAFREAWDYLKANKGAAIYYYSRYERTIYRKLQRKYPKVCTRNEIDDLFDDTLAIDLYTGVVQKATMWPTRDHSIKTLAKYLGFNWRDTNPSGAASIEWYERYTEQRDPEVKQRILDYNEDDCVATRVLLDGIRAL